MILKGLPTTTRPTGLEDETALVNAFVVAHKRERLLAKLSGPREQRDEELREHLPHESRWDPRYVVPIAAAHQTARRIGEELERRGAGPDLPVYVLSASPRLDARRCTLEEALRDVVGSSSGTVICCIPGRLAYYEGEEAGRRFILSR